MDNTELSSAIAACDAATAEALERGLIATKPLTATRLRELCELGEKMMFAERRKQRALGARVGARL